MDPDRIDLSSLDPSRDPKKWESMIRATVNRSFVRVHPMWSSMVHSGRLMLAAAALIAAVAWVPGLMRSRSNLEVAKVDTAERFAEWADDGAVPSSVNLIDTMQSGRIDE